MSRRRRVTACIAAVVSLVAAGCSRAGEPRAGTEEGTPRQTAPSPTRTSARPCQPFPDLLIDNFIRYYNGRSEDALERLVTDRWIDDVVASGYDGRATFEGVRQWAEAGWRAGDRLDLVGYSAFHKSNRGFQMMLIRRSRVLGSEAIPAVTVALDAVAHGCSIESLEMSGNVQARGDPCRFYDAFGHVPEVGRNEPLECVDDSADHARDRHAMVWTGEQALIWGGHRGGIFEYPDAVMDGLTFASDDGRERWGTIWRAPYRKFVPDLGVWTGNEMIVIGDSTAREQKTIAAGYDPLTERWRRISFPYKRWNAFAGVWTGGELVLWGGPSHTRDLRLRGAIYNPVTDKWRQTAPAPIEGRDSHVAVWTGSEMLVWGGSNWRSYVTDGAAYDPATDSWSVMAPAPILPRGEFSAIWTGTEMIVWGGNYARSLAGGGAYNPFTDTWRKLARAPIEPRHYHSATWTGAEMIVFGGHDFEHFFDDGAIYNPVTDSWRKIPPAPIAPRFGHEAVWDGRYLFVYGGNPGWGHPASGDGALYNPRRNRWAGRVIPRV